MAVLFGTDGARGVANKELTPMLAFKLGRAGAYVLTRDQKRPKIVIGKDTRISGDMLEAALIAGICSVGVDVYKVGILPTPGIAYLTRKLDAAAGVVISASHNQVIDNGIKFFGGNGFKLPDEVEGSIEALVFNDIFKFPVPTGGDVGRVTFLHDATDQYVDFLKSTIDTDFSGLKIVVDCANGAAYQVAPRVFSELGAEVIPIFNEPDGVNINEKCGSTHPEILREKVVEYGADFGFAHDGDADRLIAVDEKGEIVDGDKIMLICALYLRKHGRLTNDSIAITVMSNLGLHIALKEKGINVLETKVGDRYVLEEMLAKGAVFGGEQSGHIIFLEHNTTGDGVLTALQLANVAKRSGHSLSRLAGQMTRYPQVLINTRVNDKQVAMESPEVADAIKAGEARLGDKGRILVRPSGTEPLVRVMAEGPDQQELQEIVENIVTVIKSV